MPTRLNDLKLFTALGAARVGRNKLGAVPAMPWYYFELPELRQACSGLHHSVAKP
ncbi:hypothetical protein LF1_23790 [Rubripirellula obstinata]|uniref:Uncharacterized protein n=1 Tax=Rubripirellula obstinata TaxID=406547 RepID=A0A5B1CHY5_9BACT|nr:hypothetical protein LF1_23790 [Rubripirellula obstinata]